MEASVGTLDHFPEVRDAMVAADWAYMAMWSAPPLSRLSSPLHDTATC